MSWVGWSHSYQTLWGCSQYMMAAQSRSLQWVNLEQLLFLGTFIPKFWLNAFFTAFHSCLQEWFHLHREPKEKSLLSQSVHTDRGHCVFAWDPFPLVGCPVHNSSSIEIILVHICSLKMTDKMLFPWLSDSFKFLWLILHAWEDSGYIHLMKFKLVLSPQSQ